MISMEHLWNDTSSTINGTPGLWQTPDLHDARYTSNSTLHTVTATSTFVGLASGNWRLLGYKAAYKCNCLPTFRRNVMSSSSVVDRYISTPTTHQTLKTKALRPFETSVLVKLPATQRSIPQDSNPQPQHCGKLKLLYVMFKRKARRQGESKDVSKHKLDRSSDPSCDGVANTSVVRVCGMLVLVTAGNYTTVLELPLLAKCPDKLSWKSVGWFWRYDRQTDMLCCAHSSHYGK